MRPFVARPLSCLKGEVRLAGDKSIAHRAVIISALSNTTTIIENFPTSKDCLLTVKAFKKLGIKIKIERPADCRGSTKVTVTAGGLWGFKKAKGPVFVGGSGTTLRLILGVLAGQDFKTKLIAGKSLSLRPMLRVTRPLRMMGAKIKAKVKRQKSKVEEYPPITIKGGRLKPITYKMPIASAQVKSAILLAALYTRGQTAVIERIKTRDHTERMLHLFKADIKIRQNTILIKGNKRLVSPGRIFIPGDISSAGFFIVLGAILSNSQILIKNVGLNPSRLGMLKVLKRIGGRIKIQNRRLDYEPRGDLLVKSSSLKGTVVRRKEIPSLIDELPILMVAACCAKGKTVFEGVQELRVKETDRIKSMVENLRKMGAGITVSKKGESENIIIEGVRQLKGARVRSFADHRTAMSMVIAGLAAIGETKIDDVSCIDKSFPHFFSLLKSLTKAN